MTKQQRGIAVIAAAVILSAAGGCSNGVPLGPAVPSSPSSAAPVAAPAPPPANSAAPVAYMPDLKPVFDADCTPCHGGSRPAARYSTATYTGVMAAVRAGSASSALVVVTQPGGIMYPLLSGDRASKAALISTWVLKGAPETR